MASSDENNFTLADCNRLTLIPEMFSYIDGWYKKNFLFNVYSEGVLIVDRDSVVGNPDALDIIAEYALRVHQIDVHTNKYLPAKDIMSTHDEVRELLESSTKHSNQSDAQSDFKKIIELGVQNNASDIHITIKKNTTDIIYRIDGSLVHNVRGVPQFDAIRSYKMLSAAINYDAGDGGSEQFDKISVLSRKLSNFPVMLMDSSGAKTVKEIVNLRIEKNAPHETDVTKTVIRILRNANSTSDLIKLGIDEKDIEIIKHFVQQEQGSIIISGPTASGKSSTLHAFINQIPNTKSILTIEDPVELPSNESHIIQYDISKFKGDDRTTSRDPNKAYDSYIKSALRQDPNVMMIGEIRDENVAEKFIRAAYTGHLVLSTLHTNDAMSIIPRLVDLKISAFVLSQKKVINLLMSQRLVPLLCPNCKIKMSENDDVKKMVLKGPHKEHALKIYLFNHRGCKNCNYTGTVGRKLVYEHIIVDAKSRQFILKQDLVKWGEHLKDMGWRSMQDRAWDIIKDGDLCPIQADEIIGDVIYDTNLNYHYENGFS
jgi:type IV pilus assembly protein PilB